MGYGKVGTLAALAPASPGRGRLLFLSHASNVMKDTALTSGLTLKVPLFVKVGDRVKVDTESHKYLGKESGFR